jgi:hypothetical protein
VAKKKVTGLPETLEVGMLVRFKDGVDRGTYAVFSVDLARDGSVTLYGGDADPSGHRCFRAVMPERLQLEDRKAILAKRHREDQP